MILKSKLKNIKFISKLTKSHQWLLHLVVVVVVTRPQTRFVLTPKAESEIGATLKDACQWIPLEKRSSDLLRNVADSEVFIPGSGIAKSLFQRW